MKVKGQISACRKIFPRLRYITAKYGLKPELLSRNFIFLLGKWYINKKKSQDQIIRLSDFLAILKSKLIILQSLYRLKEQTVRFNESF